MREFLIQANRFLYRIPDSIIVKSLPQNDMKFIEYRNDNYTYRNYFTEGTSIYGQVIISQENKPLWAMQYHGGVTSKFFDERTVRTLKNISMKNQGYSNDEFPIRGPRENQFAEWIYSNSLYGTVGKFQGQETIQMKEEVCYSIKMSGGSLF